MPSGGKRIRAPSGPFCKKKGLEIKSIRLHILSEMRGLGEDSEKKSPDSEKHNS